MRAARPEPRGQGGLTVIKTEGLFGHSGRTAWSILEGVLEYH